MKAYYNENDPQVAAWLRELIRFGQIADGDVDERSIEDVKPTDLAGYTQCHFFAGIGGWSLALRLAGWPDDRPVWTGSCPCQPFSAAGKGEGADDPRHLWPSWNWLIGQCRPAIVFGEQVASKAGREWFASVQTDLQGLGYATAAADICAAGVGAPHWRQRLWFVGLHDTPGARQSSTRQGSEDQARDEARVCGSERGRGEGGMVDTASGEPRETGSVQPGGEHGLQSQGDGIGELADGKCNGQHGTGDTRSRRWKQSANVRSTQRLADDRRASHERGGGSCEASGTPGSVEGETQELERCGATHRTSGASGELANGDDTGPQGRPLSAERSIERPVGSDSLVGIEPGSLERPRDSQRLAHDAFKGRGQAGRHARGDNETSKGWSGNRAGDGSANVQPSGLVSPQPEPFASALNGPWGTADWILCTDGKWRPVEPGTFPLAHGVPDRVGLLRGYGNAIVPQVAQVFIETVMEGTRGWTTTA